MIWCAPCSSHATLQEIENDIKNQCNLNQRISWCWKICIGSHLTTSSCNIIPIWSHTILYRCPRPCLLVHHGIFQVAFQSGSLITVCARMTMSHLTSSGFGSLPSKNAMSWLYAPRKMAHFQVWHRQGPAGFAPIPGMESRHCPVS